MEKIVFEDEDRVIALSGTIIEETTDFITLEQTNRIIRIAKRRVIKIEQSKGD